MFLIVEVYLLARDNVVSVPLQKQVSVAYIKFICHLSAVYCICMCILCMLCKSSTYMLFMDSLVYF